MSGSATSGGAEAAQRDWDVLVIGTGIGGGTIGRALAEAGLSVLFVEKGRTVPGRDESPLDAAIADPEARRVRGGWPDPVLARIDGHESRIFAPLGSGVGGSSVFYAATLERPEPHDFDHSDARPHPAGGWPVSWAEMQPWFDAAARLYHLHGSPDPLSATPYPALTPPPPLGAGDAAVMARLRARGLNPYRLHAAQRFLPGCRDCLGRKCPRACKMDGRSAGVIPALATGRAALLERSEVLRLVGDGQRVSGVEIRHDDGSQRTLAAARVVLAAGALSSPRLLLASRSTAWPEGLGNRHDQAGRHLMFHLNEMVAAWPGRGAAGSGPSKAVGFRDLYFQDGRRQGMVQALGVNASYGEITHYLKRRVEASPLGRFRLARESVRLPALAAARLLGTAKIFVGLLEDLPNPENRVTHDAAAPGRIAFDYRVTPELHARRRAFRRAIRGAFRGQWPLLLGQAPDPNLGHGCGTLRMGRDPKTSVTGVCGRVHGVDNLWVADASVFASSMGVNPSLTIAANALRLAGLIVEDRR